MSATRRAPSRPPAIDLPDLQQRIGVTRVARMTGLDRTGVEVACAVRPGGHVLQVSHGRGESFEEAARGAVMEAAELWAAEHVDPAELVFASRDELAARFGPRAVLDAASLGSGGRLLAPALWDGRIRCAWRVAEDLNAGGRIYLPAQAIHSPPASAVSLGPIVVGWSSNGGAAHVDRETALLHALLEAVERDQLARTLPDGWTPAVVRARMLGRRYLEEQAPRTAARARAIEAGGFQVFLFQLAPPGQAGLGLAVAGALLFDRERGAAPLSAGYACRLDPDEALLAAMLEAAQSRLAGVHGAGEDGLPAAGKGVTVLRELCAQAAAKAKAPELPRIESRSVREALQKVLDRLHARGHGRVLAVDVGSAGKVRVVKVVVPTFQSTERR